MENFKERVNVLKKRLSIAQATLKSTEDTQNYYTQLWRDQKKEIVEIQKEIDRLSGRTQPVSDHVVVRFLERVQGVDIGLVRKEIEDLAANPRVSDFTSDRHTVSYKGKDYQVVIKNGVIVSIF